MNPKRPIGPSGSLSLHATQTNNPVPVHQDNFSRYSQEQRITSHFLGLIRNRASSNDNLTVVREALLYFKQDRNRTIEFLRRMYYLAGAGSLSESIVGLVYHESTLRRLFATPKKQPHKLKVLELAPRFLRPQPQGSFENCLENYLIIKKVLTTQDFRQRAKAIDTMRGKDGGFDRNKGYLYLPFLEEASQAVASLTVYATRCAAVFSIERGGALLSDHIENLMRVQRVPKCPPFFKVSKWANAEDRQSEHHRSVIASNVQRELLEYISCHRNQPVTIGFCETMVSGDSANRLLEMLNPVAQKCPNARFIVLLLRQSLNQSLEIQDTKAIQIACDCDSLLHSQFTPKRKLIPDVYGQFHIRMATVRWIPGEDVDYLTRYKENAGVPNKRLIVFDGTEADTIQAVEISHDGTARQALSQLIAEDSARTHLTNAMRVVRALERARIVIGSVARELAKSGDGETSAYGDGVLRKLGLL